MSSIDDLIKKFAVPNEPLTSSTQDGPPGHCILAQVFGLKKSIACMDATDDPEIANAYAKLFAAAPVLLKIISAQKAERDFYLRSEYSMDSKYSDEWERVKNELDRLVEEAIK